ncbi:ABC transporter permease [Kibdelosporangium persicum]|uniref:Permease component of ABC-type sugar transport system n=1 Tax=Kibdelosporangium persicum TaxID=2698649 RepID=A0ABX2FAZ2_9PSEU|nr:ABC transporter permease [Kibdelosporangium persicum]NRN68388.1 Permease component of ABC-type sugar transport system [Kibdelosporangium persicum]
MTTLDGLPTAERRSLGARLLSANTFWIALVLLALIVVFSAIAPESFLTFFNFQQLFIETAVLLVIAVGMTFVIITGGIDLSVGSVLIFAGMISAKTMEWMSPGQDASNAGWGVITAGLVVAIAGGSLWGLINGLLVARANIPPLIVTLGTLGAALGVASLLNDGTNVRTVPLELRDSLGFGTLEGNIPNLVVVAVVITVIFGLVLHTTRFGRYTFAIGSNPEAARRAGIGVTRHLTNVYLLTGFLAGIAGFMSLAYFQSTTISGHTTDNLNAIAGVVMGGTSLFGGIGTILGTVIGVFIPAVLQKGFNIIGVQPYWQMIAVGAVLVAAVWFDQQRRRSQNKR